MTFKHIFYDWGGLNVAWFEAINHATPDWLAPIARLGSTLGNYWGGPFLMTALVFLWWHLKTAHQSTAAFAVRVQTQRLALGLVATWIAVALTKLLVDSPRPLVALPDMVRVIGEPELQYSFPSGHAAYTILAVISLWPLVPSRFRIGLLAWLAWVGWSRIAVGAHFPADVFAGFLIGGLLAAITHLATEKHASIAEDSDVGSRAQLKRGSMMGWHDMRGYYSKLTPEQMKQRQYMMDQYMGMQQMMMDHMMQHQNYMGMSPSR